MNGSRRLFADGLYDSRVRVAKGVYAQTGDEIQVAFAVEIEQENAFAAGDDERIAVVGLEQKLAFALDDFLEGAHRRNLILPDSGFYWIQGRREMWEMKELTNS